jgi:hypothetical protein
MGDSEIIPYGAPLMLGVPERISSLSFFIAAPPLFSISAPSMQALPFLRFISAPSYSPLMTL